LSLTAALCAFPTTLLYVRRDYRRIIFLCALPSRNRQTSKRGKAEIDRACH